MMAPKTIPTVPQHAGLSRHADERRGAHFQQQERPPAAEAQGGGGVRQKGEDTGPLAELPAARRARGWGGEKYRE